MKIFSKSIVVAMMVLVGSSIISCTNANEYEDTSTDNLSWSEASHPDSLAGVKYVRAVGIKTNAYGTEVQGFVESLDFVSTDSVAVKMSQGVTEGTWTDESNTEKVPFYYYTYNSLDGKVVIKKWDASTRQFTDILMGSAVSTDRELITIVHFGDTPAQTYLVKQ